MKVRPVGTKEACRWRNDDDHGVQQVAMSSTREREGEAQSENERGE